MDAPESSLIEEALDLIHSSSATCVSDVLGAICRDAGADYGVLLSLVANSHLEFDAVYGYPEADVLRFRGGRRNLKMDDGISLCVRVLRDSVSERHPQPRVFPGDHPSQYKITDGIGETLIYPIPLRNRFFGTLALECRSEGVLSELVAESARKAPFATYARLLTLALHERQSVIFRFNEFLATAEEPGTEEFYNAVLAWIAEEFTIGTSSVYLMERSGSAAGEMLVCTAARIMGSRENSPRKALHRIGEGYAGWIAKHGVPLILPDFHTTSGPVLDYYEAQSGERPVRSSKLFQGRDVTVRSYAGFPLAEGRRVFGVLQTFYDTRESVFSEERLLEMIGMRLGRELYHRDRELRRNQLFELPSIETSSPQAVIRGVVDVAMEVAAATHGWYMQYEAKAEQFVPKAVRGEGLEKGEIPAVPADAADIVARVSRTRREVVCPDLDQPDADVAGVLTQSFRPSDAKSALIVPVYLRILAETLESAGQQYEDLGVLVLYSYRKGAFVDDDIVVTALAELVSYHIWGIRKLDELRKARADVTRLEESVSLYNQVVAATAAAPSAVHTAKKHVNQVQPWVKQLQGHRKVKEDRELLELVGRIYTSVEELNEFHERMHEIFAFQPRFEPCDLRSLVNEARGFLNSTFSERKIKLTVGQFPHEFPVYVDHLLMKVVFINMLQNSLEAGARKITVSGEACEIRRSGFPRPGIQIVYSDDGVGIAQDDWLKIFEPFFTKNKEKGSGSGLGMVVAKDVLARHFGTIDVHKSSVGEGVTFVLRCPCRPDQNTSRQQEKT
jgi:GAF domain-containing protein